MPFKLVIVQWRDSIQPTGQWENIDEYKPSNAAVITSVGFLIHKDKNIIALAPNMGDIDGTKESLQASGFIHIPVCAVIKITPLRLPK